MFNISVYQIMEKKYIIPHNNLKHRTRQIQVKYSKNFFLKQEKIQHCLATYEMYSYKQIFLLDL